MAGYEFNEDYYATASNEKVIWGINYRVVTDLASEPVTTTFFKNHARIDFDTDDTLVASYLIAARMYLEQWSQLSFGAKTIGLTALRLPKYYKLMYGPVNVITSPASGFTLSGDILKEGGTDIDIEYTTTGIINDLIRVAICRYAAGLYASRENIFTNRDGTAINPDIMMDEAMKMIRPYANLTI